MSNIVNDQNEDEGFGYIYLSIGLDAVLLVVVCCLAVRSIFLTIG